MTFSRLARAVPYVALVLVPLGSACFEDEDHSVGSDTSDAGMTRTGADTGTKTDAPSCVTVDVSKYDRSCTTDSDCISVTAGNVCSGQCECGGSAINASSEATYNADVAGIAFGICRCPKEPVACVNDVCSVGNPGGDAGNDFDASSCVNIDVSSYDRSCTTKSDCIAVTSGDVCNGACACNDSAINASSEAAYTADIAGIVSDICPCPATFVDCMNDVCVTRHEPKPDDAGSTCSSTSQCPTTHGPEECVPGGVPTGCGGPSTCDLTGVAWCSADTDCDDAGAGDVCQSDSCACPPATGMCVPACSTAADCGAGQACQTGHCVAAPCTTDSDCDANFACNATSHACEVKACQTDGDCAGFCVQNLCAAKAGACVPVPL